MVDMLTGIDGEATGVWLTLAEVARRRHVSRAAISKRVKRLGLATRPGPGGSILVELASFDQATHETTAVRQDPAERKATAKAVELPSAAVEKLRYEAALKRLDLEERLKNLVPIREVEDAMVRAGEGIVRAIEQLPNFAAQLMAATREGEPAVRRKLREIKDHIRRQAAEALVLLKNEGEAQELAGGYEFDLGEIEGREESHG
ncbi:hypothetical protein NKH53_28995 [Mesorhizobium australicum]|uniref:hypothetical protein n=1 Tax=Mesorhizobium australicum TaxID=536018 RepID=UPI003338062A